MTGQAFAEVGTVWRRIAMVCVTGFYLVGLGFLGGIMAERIRFDRQRAVILQRHDSAVRRVHEQLMSLEVSQPPARRRESR